MRWAWVAGAIAGCALPDKDAVTDPTTSGDDDAVAGPDAPSTTPPPSTPTVDSGTSTGDTGATPTETTTTPPSGLAAPIITGNCDGAQVDAWIAPYLYAPELHIFGVYESDGGHGAPPGNLTVQIDRPAEMVLALSSYEPVDWTIVVAAGAVIDNIVVNGYEPQTVTVVDLYGAAVAVPVDNHSPASNGWFGVVPFSTQGGYYLTETQQFIGDMETVSGLTATAFWGCYHSTGFHLQ